MQVLSIKFSLLWEVCFESWINWSMAPEGWALRGLSGRGDWPSLEVLQLRDDWRCVGATAPAAPLRSAICIARSLR